MNPTVTMLVQVLALVGVGVCVFLFLEEQMETALTSRRARKAGAGGTGAPGAATRLLRSVTGASLDDQLIEVLLMISSSLKAGRNLDQAFELVAISSPPPICNEFRTLVQERRLGVPMVEALTNLTKRVPSPDLRLAVNATIFQQETGGNLEDLYRQIVSTVAERKKIAGKVQAGTAHARLSGSLIAMVPIGLGIFMFAAQPGYLMPMFRHPWGSVALIASFMASIIGMMFIRRMTTGLLPEGGAVGIVPTSASRKRGWFLLLLSPLTKLLGSINASFGGSFLNAYREDIKFLLESAGHPWDMGVDEFIGLQETIALLLVLLGILIPGPGNITLLWAIGLLVLVPIGFHLPRVYLGNLIRTRQQNIEFELPYTIDLLSLAIEAGLDLVGGIQKIAEKSRPTDIVIEFQTFLADVKMGKSLEEALSDMADRVQVLSFFAFVSSLIQAQRLGAEIGPTLRSQAEQMRYQRMILAEERVNQLPVKLLLPLVFMVFPAIAVLLVGPAILRLSVEMKAVGAGH
ncbi:MAG: Flp pilus assembly protein TadB [Candidatus Ozemobacter sibiricus]|uniref:Flp pilus assembly protein TadB n=1 Tax=Candidatus Ozemobacter sibiricus TaxID=2268124 RepID=A0A367ZMX1_9BACT|nr:MAG: Flp pilus assembly protein TadB [Candidatus Ozemobacter sibiricus]